MPIVISPTLTLPSDAVTQTFAFLARRGAGKSYGAMKLAEGMLDAGDQIVALDPVGVWYSLRIAADGKGKGFDIPILGGLHGDIPLEPGAGALIADLIVDRGISVVLDVSAFRKHERKRFATVFAEQLFHRKKERRSPLHVFIEEAQVFVPQQASTSGGDRDPQHGLISEARMLGAYEDLIKLGRNFGVGVTLISQRPQAVNKDALNQTEALFVLQTNGPQERKALLAWIIEQGIATKALVDELPGLPIGTAFLWSPQWLHKLEKVKIGKRKTYDASATPVAGMERVDPRPLTEKELGEVRSAMAQTIEKAKADDPKALHAKIRELEAELKKRPAEELERIIEKVVQVPVPVLSDENRAVLERWATNLTKFVESSTTAAQKVVDGLREALDRCADAAGRDLRTALPARSTAQSRTVRDAPPRQSESGTRQSESPRRSPVTTDGKLSGAARKVLDAIAMLHPKPVTRRQIGMLSGYRYTSGHFSNTLGELRVKGMIENAGSGVERLTSAGAAAAADAIATRPTTSASFIDMWLANVSGPASKLLRVLVDEYPKGLPREELGQRAGYSHTSGHFSNIVGELRGAGVVDVDRGEVRAADELFAMGR